MTISREGVGAVPCRAWLLLALVLPCGSARASDEGIQSGAVKVLEFDEACDVDLEPYGTQLLEIVKRAWAVPPSAREGRRGGATFHFEITAAGDVQEFVILRSRGRDELTSAAAAAIRDSSPFPPPPPEAVDCAPIGVSWSFTYNLDRKERARWARKAARARERYESDG